MKVDAAKHDQFQTPGGKIFQQFGKFCHELGGFQLILFAGWRTIETQDSKRLINVVQLSQILQ